MGGGAKIVEIPVKNEPVLNALTMIHTGVNYGYDQKSWKRWFVEQSTPQRINLRRRD